MSHYFENDENLKSNRKKTVCTINDVSFTFYTDSGVFAKKGLDFGSRLLLLTVLKEKIKGNVLDVGCGYGVLGIVLNKFWRVPVVMVDINKRALHLAEDNKKINGCENVSVIESDCYQKVEGKYGLIITNPPIRAGAKKVYEILLGAKDHLEDDGILYFVIRKDQGAKTTISALKEAYNITIVEKKKGFFIIRAKKS